MIVRKSKISNLIKKERAKERKICQKETEKQLKDLSEELHEYYKTQMKQTSKDHRFEIRQKNNEIKKLKAEIENNHKQYQRIRLREQDLDNMSAELESVIETVSVKMQESIQPFYRTRAKVETAKRKSDKSHNKVENIFKAVQ